MIASETALPVVQVFQADQHVREPIGPYTARVWRSRHLVLALVRSERRARHFTTGLGEAWNIFEPLLQACIYFVLVGILRGGARSNAERLTLLIACVFLFSFTRTTVQRGANSVVGNRQLLTNSRVPRIVLPLTGVLGGMLQLAPGLGVYAVIHLATGRPVTTDLLLLPVIFICQTVITLGITLLLTTLTVFVRDTPLVLGYVANLWTFVTPVIYTLDDIKPSAEPFVVWNPMYPVFASYQAVLLGRAPESGWLLGAAAWGLGTVVIGTYVFRKYERGFAARV